MTPQNNFDHVLPEGNEDSANPADFQVPVWNAQPPNMPAENGIHNPAENGIDNYSFPQQEENEEMPPSPPQEDIGGLPPQEFEVHQPEDWYAFPRVALFNGLQISHPAACLIVTGYAPSGRERNPAHPWHRMRWINILNQANLSFGVGGRNQNANYLIWINAPSNLLIRIHLDAEDDRQQRRSIRIGVERLDGMYRCREGVFWTYTFSISYR